MQAQINSAHREFYTCIKNSSPCLITLLTLIMHQCINWYFRIYVCHFFINSMHTGSQTAVQVIMVFNYCLNISRNARGSMNFSKINLMFKLYFHTCNSFFSNAICIIWCNAMMKINNSTMDLCHIMELISITMKLSS